MASIVSILSMIPVSILRLLIVKCFISIIIYNEVFCYGSEKIILTKRQADYNNYNWRIPSKTPPPFVTKSKTEEPELRVYPMIDNNFRMSRTRDEYNTPQRTSQKRIIYYASLPDVTSRYPTVGGVRNDRGYLGYQKQIPPPLYQQRNYDVSSNLHDNDYTKVQSPIIDVLQTPDKNRYNHHRYTILEPDTDIRFENPGYIDFRFQNPGNRFVYNLEKNRDKNIDYNNRYQNNFQKNHYHQYGSGSYNIVERTPKSSGYPRRHIRFPNPPPLSVSNYLDFNNIFPPTPSSSLPSIENVHEQSPIDFQNFQHQQPNLDSSSLDLGGGGGVVDDSDFNDISTVSPLKQKYFGFNNFLSTQSPLSQKYLDFNTFQTDDFSRDKFLDYNKFDPFKTSVSDWIANKPLDLPPFDLDDLNGVHTISIDTQLYRNATNSNLINQNQNLNNTLITPFGYSNSSGFHSEGSSRKS